MSVLGIYSNIYLIQISLQRFFFKQQILNYPHQDRKEKWFQKLRLIHSPAYKCLWPVARIREEKEEEKKEKRKGRLEGYLYPCRG